MSKAMEEKRKQGSTASQTKLPKKRRVSQGDATKNKILVEASYQALPEAMSLLLWNCRELGNPHTENELVRLIQVKDLSVVFIAETWTDEVRLDRTLSKINFD